MPVSEPGFTGRVAGAQGDYRAEIEIDGGVTVENAPRCVAAGADVLVAASAVFNDRASIGDNIRALRESVGALQT